MNYLNHHFFNYSSINPINSFGLIVGLKYFITLPCLSTKNFEKFHGIVFMVPLFSSYN